MYNEPLKRLYLDSLNPDLKEERRLICYFNVMEQKESEYNNDLSLFNKDEVLEADKFINPTSANYLNVLNIFYGKYTQFLIDNKEIPHIDNAYFNISISDMQKCINQELIKCKIIYRKDLLRICDSVAPRDAFAMMCLFEGIEGREYSEISNIKNTDIDYENRIIHLATRDVSVSDELLKYAKQANEVEYGLKYPSMTRVPLVDSQYIYKNTCFIKNGAYEPASMRNISLSIVKILKMFDLDKYLSPKDIRNSGKLYYVQQMSIESGISPSDILRSVYKIKALEERFGCAINGKLLLNTYKDHLL